MNKSELIAHISKKTGISKSKASLFLDTFSDIAVSEVNRVGLFRIPGIGVLKKDVDTLPTPDEEELNRRVAAIRKRGISEEPDGVDKPERTTSTTTQYYRDPEVKAWILEQAKAHCEQCGADAPFRLPDEDPYLEEHHVLPLAEGGSDTTSNAVALCPNCHRHCHLGKDREAFIEVLYSKVTRLKKELPKAELS